MGIGKTANSQQFFPFPQNFIYIFQINLYHKLNFNTTNFWTGQNSKHFLVFFKCEQLLQYKIENCVEIFFFSHSVAEDFLK